MFQVPLFSGPRLLGAAAGREGGGVLPMAIQERLRQQYKVRGDSPSPVEHIMIHSAPKGFETTK
ncbi:hypothetical protein LIA77_01408 [Sarocladium implicatum]|nr:hypothetical protein LIA77_01408 [Sarocladium implicatum]